MPWHPAYPGSVGVGGWTIGVEFARGENVRVLEGEANPQIHAPRHAHV